MIPGMTWTAPQINRTNAPTVGDERTILEGYLDYHRQTLLAKCAGLTEEQLKTAAVPPSNLTLLGLVRHMADVERWWFRRFPGEDLPSRYSSATNQDGDFDDVAGADPAADFAAFDEECQASRQAAAKLSLDQTFPRRRPPAGEISVRWIYVHMIQEYARHNGHADLIRERIDGATGL